MTVDIVDEVDPVDLVDWSDQGHAALDGGFAVAVADEVYDGIGCACAEIVVAVAEEFRLH